ncbi:uncharacterized protein LOC62_07G009458 [Vanrija pseudolonga]|uniref:Uncharacterized protein n=1 Tax=Vanrija pseudolonga TaxID=143232 RepID=A0AAF0YFN4_9TREE|nr:hypothetical protein LOC62_07G009458 [Vanrija pseudolonga]
MVGFQQLERKYSKLANELRRTQAAVKTDIKSESPAPIGTSCEMKNITGTDCGPPCPGHTKFQLSEARLRKANNDLITSGRLQSFREGPRTAPYAPFITTQLEAGLKTVLRCFTTYSLALNGRAQIAVSRLGAEVEAVRSAAEDYLSKLEDCRRDVEEQLASKMTYHAKCLCDSLDLNMRIPKSRDPEHLNLTLEGHTADQV